MTFLLRAAFWTAVVAAFVPAGFSASEDGAFAKRTYALFSEPAEGGAQALSAEVEVRADTLCAERREACALGEEALTLTRLLAGEAAQRAGAWVEAEMGRETGDAAASD